MVVKPMDRHTPKPRRLPLRITVDDVVASGDLDAWVRLYVARVLQLEGVEAAPDVAEPIQDAVP